MAFTETKTATPIIDTDMFDLQKYIEESGGNSSSVKSKRDSHEAGLTREFMDGFNQAKECDGIILMGSGDQKPDFSLQVLVDSHDTAGQHPVWVWILRDVGKDKLMPVGSEDSAKDAAKGICQAVQQQANPDIPKKASL